MDNKFKYLPILALSLLMIIGVIALAGTFLSKERAPRNQEATNPSQDQTEDQDIAELDEDQEEIEEVSDYDEDQTDTEEKIEEVSDFDEEEREEDIKESEKKKDKKEEKTQDKKDHKAESSSKNKKPYYIKINKALNTVTVYKLDENNKYTTPVKAMIASTGRATPLGKFKTSAKYDWRRLIGGVWGQYSTRITGQILFHSVPLRSKSKDTVIYNYYNNLGNMVSAGCVRLTTIDAKWIYDNCPIGTTVEIYNDTTSPGHLGKPSALKLPTNVSTGWDPTDPDPKNPWRNQQPSIVGASTKNIERCSEFSIKQGIKALDSVGNDITDKMLIEGSIDTKKLGDYKVTYSIKDLLGRTAKETVTYKVVDTTPPKIIPAKDSSLIPLSKNIDEFLLERISVTDNGEKMDPAKTEISKQKKNWGYDVSYKYTDQSGNVGTLDDQVLFNISLKISDVKKLIDVKDPNNISSNDLKNVVTARLINNNTNESESLGPNDPNYSAKITGSNSNTITVEYTYIYWTPLGNKTIKDTVNMEYTLYVEKPDDPGDD